MDDAMRWTCGLHVDSDPPFADVVRAARCPGDKRPCIRSVVMLFVTFDDNQGDHTLPALTFTGACPKHRNKVGRAVAGLAVGWLGVGEALPADVPAILAWFHGPSGLCLGDRPLSVLTPGSPRPPTER